jgi:hypothetical protein
VPIDLKIVPAREFIQTKANGEFDLEGTRELFLAVFSKMKEAKVSEVVMDLRELTTNMTASDINELLSVLNHVGSWSTWKIAIVYRPKPEAKWDRAKFFELSAQNKGYRVEAYQSFEGALNWLYPSSRV